MRSKLVLAVLVFLSTLPVLAQVAPAAKIGGLPLGVGVGMLDYNIDYASGDRMLGFSAWADYNLFHGMGIEVEGQTINLARPSHIQRFAQYSAKGGLIYKPRPFLGLHPYVKSLVGITQGNFSVRDPFYVADDFLALTFGGGLEYKAYRNLFVRADYQYQFEHDYLSLHDLNPAGVTVGLTYYMRAPHRHN
jgi:opacity protein-like surface antigen